MTDFDRVYRENCPRVYRFLMALCKNSDIAEELTQETFFKVYMNLSSVKDESKLSSYIMTVARNCFYALCREQKKREELDEKLESPLKVGEELEAEEAVKEAKTVVASLEEPYAEVFMLHIQGVPLKEISRLYSKSESWARVTFHRAKMKASERMKKNEM